MKIAAVSDMHGNLTNVLEIIDRNVPELLISCGDWGDPGEVDRSLLAEITSRVPVLTIYGNHDDPDALSAKNLDGSPILLPQGEVRDYGGLRFAGISGIWAKSRRKPCYVTDEDVAALALRLGNEHVDILLSHGCPIGLADALPGGRRGGQRCFLDAFHMISPRLYLCGHLHFPQDRTLKDGRILINIGYTCEGDYWVLEVGPKEVDFSRLRL